MQSFLQRIQALPEHKRHIALYATFAAGALAIFLFLGISINARITENGDTHKPLFKTETGIEATTVSPVQGFFGSFNSLKHFFVDENTVNREKNGLSQLALVGREYAKGLNNSVERLGNYIYEHWLTKNIGN